MIRFQPLGIFFLFLFSLSNLIAQPSSTPAAGHEWILAGSQTYTDGPSSTEGASGNTTIDCGNGSNTTTCGSNDTSFGWDIQCSTTPNTVVGTAGANFIQAQVFGNIGTTNNLELVAVPCNPGVGGTNPNDNWPTSTSETRRIILTNWNNTNPDAGVSDGATEGTVWIPTSATLTFRDDGVGDGTGAGADELKFLVIGGNGGQCSSWDITANYDLSINAGPYSSIVGTENKIEETINQSLSNVPDAGSGNTYHATDDLLHNSGCGSFQGASWYFPGGINTGSFGAGFSQSFDILSALVEDGSTFDIDFISNQSISLSRSNGNADAKVTMGPGMGGKVELVINYQIWEILAPLPVDLTDFTAKKDNNGVLLNWTTASEFNSDYFMIQRSSNGLDWTDLTQINTPSNSYESKYYSYFDKTPLQTNYYRLKQVDRDQTVSYSNIQQVTFEYLQPSISIAPNPFKEQLKISGKNDSWVAYEIINQRGQLIQQANTEILNTINLEKGLYFILFRQQNGTIIDTQKVIKF